MQSCRDSQLHVYQPLQGLGLTLAHIPYRQNEARNRLGSRSRAAATTDGASCPSPRPTRYRLIRCIRVTALRGFDQHPQGNIRAGSSRALRICYASPGIPAPPAIGNRFCKVWRRHCKHDMFCGWDLLRLAKVKEPQNQSWRDTGCLLASGTASERQVWKSAGVRSVLTNSDLMFSK